MRLTYTLPADAPIGIYDLRIKDAQLPPSKLEFVVLFNPWARQDAVYMEDEAGRTEYVERTKGGIWQSRESAPGKMDDGFVLWGFDQNTKIVLDVALDLLRRSREGGSKPEHVLTGAELSSPTDVTRWLSLAINKFVLTGKWDKPYNAPPNTFPWTWLGSSEILHKYYDGEKKQPVRYGQCWVFSGVYTSLARALGIPTRSVTNFDSAHDSKPFDAFSDVYLKLEPEFEYVDGMTADSTWNFHVWNDVWFRRSGDKTGSADGWQAVDATPQETSGGSYQMGPASLSRVKALGKQLEGHEFDEQCDKTKKIWTCKRKEGAIEAATKDYDETFVMGEVNSDKRFYALKYDEAGKVTSKKHIMTEHHGIGSAIYTQKKGAGLGWFNDVVSDYRGKDGDHEHKEVVRMSLLQTKGLRASASASAAASAAEAKRTATAIATATATATDIGLKSGRRKLVSHMSSESDVATFQPILPVSSQLRVGDSIVVGLKSKAYGGTAPPRGKAAFAVHVSITGIANTYSNTLRDAGGADAVARRRAPDMRLRKVVMLTPGADWSTTKLTLTLKDYLPFVEDSPYFQFTISARVEGTTQVYLLPDVAVQFRMPKVQVSAWHLQKTVLAEHAVVARASWTNPLKMGLTECAAFAHVSGTDHSQQMNIGEMAPLEEFSTPFAFDVDACDHGVGGVGGNGDSCDRVVSVAITCKELPDSHGYTELDTGGSGGLRLPDEESEAVVRELITGGVRRGDVEKRVEQLPAQVPSSL